MEATHDADVALKAIQDAYGGNLPFIVSQINTYVKKDHYDIITGRNGAQINLENPEIKILIFPRPNGRSITRNPQALAIINNAKGDYISVILNGTETIESKILANTFSTHSNANIDEFIKQLRNEGFYPPSMRVARVTQPAVNTRRTTVIQPQQKMQPRRQRFVSH